MRNQLSTFFLQSPLSAFNADAVDDRFKKLLELKKQVVFNAEMAVVQFELACQSAPESQASIQDLDLANVKLSLLKAELALMMVSPNDPAAAKVAEAELAVAKADLALRKVSPNDPAAAKVAEAELAVEVSGLQLAVAEKARVRAESEKQIVHMYIYGYSIDQNHCRFYHSKPLSFSTSF